MSVYGSGAASSAMGINPVPMGTLDELRKEGIDPATVGSCSPQHTGVSGCPYYESCIFRFTRNGGFRDHGPRNIGYFHQTHEERRVENFASCHLFMSRMRDRQQAGERDQQDGKKGEIIEIIAQEGEVIHTQVVVNINEGTTLPARYEKQTKTIPVPHFPRPGERQVIAYDTQVNDRRRLREMQRAEMATGLPIEPPRRIDPKEEIEQPPVAEVEAVLQSEPEGPVPTAAPVVKKRA